ncbi:MAG: MBL fold metallo-hydrolase [Bacteroidota bacterium]|nr:MBL fold metallo-hydrolase [Bacteroidota bacterium]
MIQRIFHPIGQGAFYSERHKGFNMVYDCGTLPKTNISGKLVKQSFKKSDKIDILFISHFDSDHVNQIETLKKHCQKINVVVMPLLHPEEKKMISNIYRCLDGGIVPLIDSPEEFFGEGTTILYVRPAVGIEDNISQEIELAQGIATQAIDSSSIIMKGTDWMYVPFNFEFAARHNALVKQLKSESIDMDKLKKDLNYALSKKTELRRVYNRLDGKINQNSMFVYSGPNKGVPRIDMVYRYQQYFHPYRYLFYENTKVGCVYTGDGDLNKVDLKQVYRKYMDLVGTIQIPHHGDIKSFNSTNFTNGEFFCPISVGSRNTYGHPSSALIADLIAHNNYVVTISENPRDLYIEVIK